MKTVYICIEICDNREQWKQNPTQLTTDCRTESSLRFGLGAINEY